MFEPLLHPTPSQSSQADTLHLQVDGDASQQVGLLQYSQSLFKNEMNKKLKNMELSSLNNAVGYITLKYLPSSFSTGHVLKSIKVAMACVSSDVNSLIARQSRSTLTHSFSLS